MSQPRSVRLPEITISSGLPQDVVEQQREHPLLRSLWVGSAGYFPKAAGHLTERDAGQASSFLAMYCLEGSGWFRSEHLAWPVRPGDLVVARPGVAHGYGADRGDPWSIQFAHFDGDDAGELLRLAGVASHGQVVAVGLQSTLSGLFNEMLTVLRSGYSLHHLVIASACLRQILSRVALISAYTPAAATVGLDVQQTIDLMLRRVTAQCTLDELAAAANLSRSAFSHRFRQKTGYAPVDYYLRLKIQKACELLATTDMAVGEVSRALGYRDPYYFSRLFKKYMGVPPSRYQSPL